MEPTTILVIVLCALFFGIMIALNLYMNGKPDEPGKENGSKTKDRGK